MCYQIDAQLQDSNANAYNINIVKYDEANWWSDCMEVAQVKFQSQL